MQSLKFISSTYSWHELNKKLEELTKSGQSKIAGDIFENLCKYFKSEKFNRKIPYTLEITYKDKWKGWRDFLGISTKPRSTKT